MKVLFTIVISISLVLGSLQAFGESNIGEILDLPKKEGVSIDLRGNVVNTWGYKTYPWMSGTGLNTPTNPVHEPNRGQAVLSSEESQQVK